LGDSHAHLFRLSSCTLEGPLTVLFSCKSCADIRVFGPKVKVVRVPSGISQELENELVLSWNNEEKTKDLRERILRQLERKEH
jgi:hypothetical protein